MRTESDFLGTVTLPDDALYGIHAFRAKENFPDITPFHLEWFQAVAWVKLAIYQASVDFFKAVEKQAPEKVAKLNAISSEVLGVLEQVAFEAAQGIYFEHFIVPAVQGGAGTSINMNMNEILANAALVKLGQKPGEYHRIDPIEAANIFQSTNDVIPTSLKLASMFLLEKLEATINDVRIETERLEQTYRNALRIGYTQMQEAVPSSWGKLFSAYSDALSRDWWRVSKCFERIKVVNLGGSAIGTGIAVPRFVIMEATQRLQKLTGMPVTRGENLMDATSNLDSFVEIHAILKSHAVNLEKMVSDLRLLASDIAARHELQIPQKQVGSSIMPAKVNPVIPEFVISVAHQVYANDQLIASLSAQGCLELNAYLPVIGHALLQSLKLLIAADDTLQKNLLQQLIVHVEKAEKQLYLSPAITTALTPYVGYNCAAELAKYMKQHQLTVFEANLQLKVMDAAEIETLLKPENLLKLGYSINDL